MRDDLSPDLSDVIHRIVEDQASFRAFLRKRVGSETVVEDVFQQCLLRAVERQHSLKNQDSAVVWFYQILRNAVIDYYRSKAAEESRHQAFEKAPAPGGPVSRRRKGRGLRLP